MRGNWSSQPHAPGKAAGDKTYSLLSYARPLEASVNAVTALKPAWNLLMCDRRVIDIGNTAGRGWEISGFGKKVST